MANNILIREPATGTTLATKEEGGVHAQVLAIQNGKAGSVTRLRLDQITGSMQVVDYVHHEIHAGSAFNFQEVITLGSGATQDYLITVPDTTKWPHFGYSVEGGAGVTVEIYEGADRTGTTAQTIVNRNRNSATTATTTLHKGQSGGTTDGTRIVWRKSGTGVSGGRAAGNAGEGQERVLKRNTKYLLRITSAAASNDVSISLDWYEHTDLANTDL
jgi:hypothetical protein